MSDLKLQTSSCVHYTGGGVFPGNKAITTDLVDTTNPFVYPLGMEMRVRKHGCGFGDNNISGINIAEIMKACLVNQKQEQEQKDYEENHTENQLVYTFNVPGCGPDSVSVSVKESVLFVSAVAPNKKYSWEVRLLKKVSVETAVAVCKNGQLTIKLPTIKELATSIPVGEHG
jgi:HSP20 family molecular chaperone IbpA